MTRSFRDLLAVRFALITTAGMGVLVLATFLVLRHILDAELNANILNVASIQAAAVTDQESGEMHFHEWDLTPEEAQSIQELVRYAEIWSADGVSLLRSRYMTGHLPTDPEALRSAAAGELVWREADFEGTPVRSVFYPLVRLGDLHHEHVLQVAAPLDTRNAMLRRVLALGGVLILLTAVGSLLGGRWLAERAVRPVTAIIDEAEAIGVGTLRHRISAYADTREYQRLVQVLNMMLDRIHAAFESQRRFTADASHELRSPLTAMRGELELALRKERSPEEYRAVVESAREEVVRLGRIVEGLLTLARSDSEGIQPRLARSDLREPVDEAIERVLPDAKRHGVSVTRVGPSPVPGLFDPDLVGQMVWNLVQNAVRYSGPGATVQVSVHSEGGFARIRVEDSGPGLPHGCEERVFERFWRADPSRTHGEGDEGIGLGLAIVKVIAEAHGGEVRASNRASGGGARFEVLLPGLSGSEPEPLAYAASNSG